LIIHIKNDSRSLWNIQVAPPTRRVGKIDDYDPLNGQWGSATARPVGSGNNYHGFIFYYYYWLIFLFQQLDNSKNRQFRQLWLVSKSDLAVNNRQQLAPKAGVSSGPCTTIKLTTLMRQVFFDGYFMKKFQTLVGKLFLNGFMEICFHNIMVKLKHSTL